MDNIHGSYHFAHSSGTNAETHHPLDLSPAKADAIRTTLESGINFLQDSYKDISESASRLYHAMTLEEHGISVTDVEAFVPFERERLDAKLRNLNLLQGHQDKRIYDNFASRRTSSAGDKRLADELYEKILEESSTVSSHTDSRSEPPRKKQRTGSGLLDPARLQERGISPDADKRVVQRGVELTEQNISAGRDGLCAVNIRKAEAERIAANPQRVPFDPEELFCLANQARNEIRERTRDRHRSLVNRQNLAQRGISPEAAERVVKRAIDLAIDRARKGEKPTHVANVKKAEAERLAENPQRVPFDEGKLNTLADRAGARARYLIKRTIGAAGTATDPPIVP